MGVVAILMVACGSGDEGGHLVSPLPSGVQNSQSTDRQSSESHMPEVVTVQDALAAIGAKCGSPKDFEATCTWDGPDFRTFILPDAQSYASMRRQLCDQLMAVAGNALVLTDGKTWSIYSSSDNDLETRLVGKALIATGLDASLQPSCET
jgi:hypothetical protein